MSTRISYSTISANKISSRNLFVISINPLLLLRWISMLLACFCLSTVVFASGKPLFSAPTINSRALRFTTVEGNYLGFSWTAGNGANRLVVMKQGGPITQIPQNGIQYTANNFFGLGQEIGPPGSGEFVVANGPVTGSNVYQLSHSTTYSIAIFEYNGTGSSTQYLTSGYQVNGATATTPVSPVSNVLAWNITGNSITLWWTNGNGERRLVVAREGSAVNADPTNLTYYYSNEFGFGSQIGTGNYVLAKVTGNSAIARGLKPGTTYHFAIYEYNGEFAPVYLIPGVTASFTTLPRPAYPPSNPLFQEIEGNSMQMSWGYHNALRTIVIAKLGSLPTAIPVDGQEYVANSSFGDPSSEIAPGEYVVINAGGSGAYVRNLVHSTNYYFKLFSSDGTGAQTVYLTTSYGSGSQSTATFPTTPTGPITFSEVSGTSMTIKWTNGSGERRLVLVRQGSPVTGSPTIYTRYHDHRLFGSGDQVGAGNYVVYAGSDSSINIANLVPSTTYHVSIFEYNGNNGPVYSNTASTAQQTAILAPPTVAPSSIVFSQIKGCSERVGWTSGNGVRRMVIAKQGSEVTASPADGVIYTANTNFGSGQQISANEYVVYDGTGNFVDIAGLIPNTTYHFKIVEYNIGAGFTAYMSTGLAGNSSTLSYPTSQATSVTTSMIGGSKVRLTWTNGTGSSRLVLMKQGSAVDTDPSDCGTPYNGDWRFGNGSELGTGNYVVFNGNDTGAEVTNLLPSTTYHVSVYEANGSPSNLFLRPGATYSFTTASGPTINSSNFAQPSSDGNQLSIAWTGGNGQRRMIVAKQGSTVTGVPMNGIDYNGNQTFGSGDAIAPGEFVVYIGDIVNGGIVVFNLIPAETYHFKIFECDGIGSNTVYLIPGALTGSASTDSTPSQQASNVSFTNVGANSLRLNWNNGNGEGRFIIARSNNPVSASPDDLVRYNDHQNFGSGFHFGNGNYAIAYSDTNFNNVYGLLSGTTYHFAIFEHNGYFGPVYLRPAETGHVTTPGPPQTQAANASANSITTEGMSITWTNGTGNRRLVLMKAGSSVDAVPVDNTNYTANSIFGSGSQLGSGNYVVHNSTGSSVTVSGLSVNTFYYFAVYEYNYFSSSSSQFLTTNPATGSAITPGGVPVKLINLKATVKNGKVYVSWTTTQESNSSHFEILRSRNGNDFAKIGQLDAAGTSDIVRDYSFVDANVSSGQYFYRLRQVDKDQKFELSRVLRIDLSKPFSITITPNPIQSEMRIDGADEAAQIELIDVTGKVIRKYQRAADNRYSVREISAGNYFVRVVGKNGIEVVKVIIQ